MTAQSPPYVLQSGSHSAQLFRQAISTLLNSAGGVVGVNDMLVAQNGAPNMSVNVAGGAPGSGGGVWVPGTSSVGVQGLYFGYNDATVNLAVAASNPTNPRIDTAIAQVQDAAYAGAVNSFQLAVVTGTPAGSPVAPTLPASSYALANVAVAALATTVVNASITDRRSIASLSPNGLASTVNAYLPGAWSSLSLSGVVAGPQAPRARKDLAGSGIFRLDGSFSNTSGSTIVAGTTVATVPVGLRPTQDSTFAVGSTGATNTVPMRVTTAGVVSFPNLAFLTGTGYTLTGVTYV